MTERTGYGGADEPVRIIRGRHMPKFFLLPFLAFMLAGYTNVYPTQLFSFDTSTRTPVDILASLIVTSAFVLWTVRAFVARVELYEDRIVYRGSQRHRVLPMTSVDRFGEDRSGTRAFLLLGNEKHYLILGTFEFYRPDVDQVCNFVNEKVREQGRSLTTETHGIAWLWKKQYLQWPPDYLSLIALPAIVWIVFVG